MRPTYSEYSAWSLEGVVRIGIRFHRALNTRRSDPSSTRLEFVPAGSELEDGVHSACTVLGESILMRTLESVLFISPRHCVNITWLPVSLATGGSTDAAIVLFSSYQADPIGVP